MLARAAIALIDILVSCLLNVSFVGGFGSGLLHIDLSILRRLTYPRPAQDPPLWLQTKWGTEPNSIITDGASDKANGIIAHALMGIAINLSACSRPTPPQETKRLQADPKRHYKDLPSKHHSVHFITHQSFAFY